jgi:hypothetical protein
MASSTVTADFVARIALDLLPDDELLARQRGMWKCGDLLRRPLPVDTASNLQWQLLPQLIRTVGSDATKMFEHMVANTWLDAQSVKILCASAASGLGKTHLAYAVGLEHVYTVFIRVAHQGEGGGGAILTKPWDTLHRRLAELDRARKSSFAVDYMDVAARVAKTAFTLVELLIYCHVDATLAALEAGVERGIGSTKALRELALRFNRNGVAENIVENLFQGNLATWAEPLSLFVADGSATICNGVNNDRIAEYRKALVDRCGRLPRSEDEASPRILLCFDEVGTLVDLLPTLFMQRAAYLATRESAAAGAGCAGGDGVAAEDPAASGEWGRGLFYALACLMCDLASKVGWAQFMTGTAFSIARFQTSGTVHSPVRGSTTLVAPAVRLSVDQMRDTLQYYWDIPAPVLDDNRVAKVLADCVGRPLFFVDAVFTPIYAYVATAGKRPESVRAFTADAVADRLQSGYGRALRTFAMRMQQLLAGTTALPGGTGENAQALVPPLVEAVLFRTRLYLDGHNLLHHAIATGLVPAVATERDGAAQVIDVAAEPLVQQALTSVLDAIIRRDHYRIMRLIAPLTHPVTGGAAGDVAEPVVAIELALRSRRLCSRPGGPTGVVSLHELLRPLFGGEDANYPEGLDRLDCRIDKAVSMKGWDLSTCALRRFVLDDDRYDDTVILYDLPKRMGLDVAFLVSYPQTEDVPRREAVRRQAAAPPSAGAGTASMAVPTTAHRNFRVVGLQLKNTAASTLADVMLTLHPGTQLLTNAQREALLAGKNFRRAAGGASGAGSADWLDFIAFAAEQPQLATDWIRVPVVARAVHGDVYRFAGQLAAGALERRFLERFTWTADRQAAAARSPVVIASLNSETWLPLDIRRAFVASPKSTMMLIRDPSVWVPAPVSTADAKFQRAGT